MLCNKAIYNGVSLEVYTTFEFQPKSHYVPFSVYNSNVLSNG